MRISQNNKVGWGKHHVYKFWIESDSRITFDGVDMTFLYNNGCSHDLLATSVNIIYKQPSLENE